MKIELSVDELVSFVGANKKATEIGTSSPPRFAFIKQASDEAIHKHPNSSHADDFYAGALWAYDLLTKDSPS